MNTFIKKLVSLALVIGITSSPGLALAGQKLEKVTIGIQSSPAMALVMVAKEKNYFEKYGLDLELKEFTAGKLAFEAFLAGSLDYSISGDVPPLLAMIKGNDFVIPAQVVKKTVNEIRVVAQKDGTIRDAKTYFGSKKRKLGTSFGGGPEFYTYEFLNSIGIKSDQVELVSQKPIDMVAALANHSVDAIAIFDPVAKKAEQVLGKNHITFTNKNIYSEVYVIEAKSSIRKDPTQVTNIIRALLDAEAFTEKHPDQAQKIVAKYTKLDLPTVKAIWSSFDFKIALTKNLVDSWAKQYVWQQKTGKVLEDQKRPVFKSYVYKNSLQKVKSSAVEKF